LVTQFEPEKVIKKIIDIDTGKLFSAALSDDGELFTWGENEHGQLGHGNEK